MNRLFILALALAPIGVAFGTDIGGWTLESPREEIRPDFSTNSEGHLIITHDQREGLDGWFQKSFPVQGGKFYRFAAKRKIQNIDLPRQSCLVRILWRDAAGRSVSIDARPAHMSVKLPMPSAEPEYPHDGLTDEEGWTTVAGVYQCPSKAESATVELHLQWAPGGQVQWRDPEFVETTVPPKRKVRLATVHYRPQGKSPRQNCEEFEPLIAEAAKQRADLVVLGETLPSANVKAKPEQIAETIPGPSTQYFAGLAQRHGFHIVLSLYERAGHLIYNTAVLLGPDGKVMGQYRKVTLPPGEAAKGIAPGKGYPVFNTAFGKVGMMICYDGFFPEVARELTKNGAEIIAWPVWGCNPKLAEARACENHVYIVSSTFMNADADWMISAVFDHSGHPIAKSAQWGTVAVAEVTLNEPYLGPYNLGDFRSMVERHRPPARGEAVPGRK